MSNKQDENYIEHLKEAELEIHEEINKHNYNIRKWKKDMKASTDIDEIDKYKYAVDMTYTLIDRAIAHLDSLQDEMFDLTHQEGHSYD